MKPHALVLLALGTNRDLDVAEALSLAGADPEVVPLNALRDGTQHFADYQMLILPGGFSYADALGAGKLLAIDMQAYFAEEVGKFVEAGKPVIGICNGFQALVKAGILPGNDVIARSREAATTLAPPARAGEQSSQGEEIASLPTVARNDICLATLTFNAHGHFECRWVTLRAVSQTCVWTRGLADLITCPIAHGEGNFQTISHSLPPDLIAITYVKPDGTPAGGEYPANPNGSLLDIAGITNPGGNVLGLMPHPENHIHPWQHPNRTRGAEGGSGLSLFRNGVKYAEAL
jgi:phosphoribosylformylglycinamidine synthase subunit PurQ / glutaminase